MVTEEQIQLKATFKSPITKKRVMVIGREFTAKGMEQVAYSIIDAETGLWVLQNWYGTSALVRELNQFEYEEVSGDDSNQNPKPTTQDLV